MSVREIAFANQFERGFGLLFRDVIIQQLAVHVRAKVFAQFRILDLARDLSRAQVAIARQQIGKLNVDHVAFGRRFGAIEALQQRLFAIGGGFLRSHAAIDPFIIVGLASAFGHDGVQRIQLAAKRFDHFRRR